MVAAGGAQPCSGMGLEVLRGLGVCSLKAARLLSGSSSAWRRAGHRAGVERRSALLAVAPPGLTGLPASKAGTWVGNGPVKAPQLTQSGGEPSVQQTAPALGERLRPVSASS